MNKNLPAKRAPQPGFILCGEHEYSVPCAIASERSSAKELAAAEQALHNALSALLTELRHYASAVGDGSHFPHPTAAQLFTLGVNLLAQRIKDERELCEVRLSVLESEAVR